MENSNNNILSNICVNKNDITEITRKFDIFYDGVEET